MATTYKKEGLEAKPFIHYLPIVIACIMFAFVPTAMQTSCNGIFLPELGKDYGSYFTNFNLFNYWQSNRCGICSNYWSATCSF